MIKNGDFEGLQDAINSVISVRRERRKIYGDGWKHDPDWAILAEIRQKYKRLEEMMMNGRNKEEMYESCVDTLVDLGNYTLFLLQNVLDRRSK